MTIEEYNEIPEKSYWDFTLINYDGDIPVRIHESGMVDFVLNNKYVEILTDDLVEIGRRAKLFRDRRIAFREKELKEYNENANLSDKRLDL